MDVGVGQVVGPDGGARVAGLEVDGDGHLARLQVDGGRVGRRRGLRQTQTPFIATSRSAGSKAACVVPMLASTRPQLGSLPKTAALNRLLRAIERPTSTASSSVAASSDGDRDLVVGALGVGEQLHGQVGAGPGQGVGEVRAGSGVIPLAPLASTVTVSLVDMQPSESSRSKLTRVAARSAVSRSSALATRVGGEHDEHGGELGGEHAGALGHARRPTSRGRRRRPAWPRSRWS